MKSLLNPPRLKGGFKPDINKPTIQQSDFTLKIGNLINTKYKD